jgi:predicted nucleic acid-binding protein
MRVVFDTNIFISSLVISYFSVSSFFHLFFQRPSVFYAIIDEALEIIEAENTYSWNDTV